MILICHLQMLSDYFLPKLSFVQPWSKQFCGWVQALESCQGSGVGSHRKFGSQEVGTAPQGAGKQGGHSRVGMCGWASSGCVPMRILDTTFLHHKSPPTLSCSTVLVGAALSSCDDGIWSFTCPWKRNENSSWTLWGVVV